MIRYYKLFDLLNRRGMKKTELLKIMSSGTLAKLSKGDVIKSDIIDKICEFLKCQPDDIMEYIDDIAFDNNRKDGTYMEIKPMLNSEYEPEEIIFAKNDIQEKENLIKEIESKKQYK
ncbi:helix-turn-helix domain-containing protein [Hungatella sp. SL.1.14]|jgi:putative transcriptional regulator|uniref:helix-turn-helix domain-containing protein n=1 Tax=unclassified Hungatella TaxID=2613923 RepID=UPI00210AA326|nr:helix-turn-helix domain-containing protein [Hungatella sp. SL.1.14]MCQ4830134.1 helix-turn-helix domain-containing protein [Hungatella sp. SL.1.14]